MSANAATASAYLPTVHALESYLEKIKTALEPSKELSTYKMAFEFCTILLKKLIEQTSMSGILLNELLKIAQFLDPRFVRSAAKNDDGSIVSTLSAQYLRLFGENSNASDNLN